MATVGHSAYHGLLVEALARRAQDYFCRWARTDDTLKSPVYEFFVGERLMLALLTAAYIEAQINLLLSLHLSALEFQTIERKTLDYKWTRAPQKFIPKYRLDDEGMSRDLKSLIERRNAVVHMRPQLTVDGEEKHQGNPFGISPADHAQMIAWLSLPYRLVDNVQAHDQEKGIQFGFLSRVDVLRHLLGQRGLGAS